VVIMAQIEAGVDGSQSTSYEVAFWAPEKLETLTKRRWPPLILATGFEPAISGL